MASKELAPAGDFGNTLVTQYSPEESMAIIRESGGDFRMWDFPRAHAPAQGTSFMFKNTPVEPEDDKVIRGVIVGWITTRAYYQQEYGKGDTTAPDCYAPNGTFGVGTPGGECAKCPLGQWDGENRPKCGTSNLILLLRENSIVPVVVQVSRGSLAAFRKYRMGMIDFGGFMYRNVTEVRLEKARARGGTEFAQMVFVSGGPVNADAAGAMKAYGEALTLSVQNDMYTLGNRAVAVSDESNPNDLFV